MAATPTQNVEIVRGSTYQLNLEVTDDDDQPVDISAGTLRMTAKWRQTDDDDDAVFALFSPSDGIDMTDPTNGLATVTIEAANTSSMPYRTSRLFYDVRFTDGSGKPWSILRGFLTVVPNTSRTTP